MRDVGGASADVGTTDGSSPERDIGPITDARVRLTIPDGGAPSDATGVDGGRRNPCIEPEGPPVADPPAVIVILGDGMGSEHIRAGSLARHGVPVPRGRAGPGLLAHVVVSKFADHLPLL